MHDDLIEINVCAPPELTDPIASFLIDQKSGGVIIEDIEDDDNLPDRKKMGWQWIRTYFPEEVIKELKGKIDTYLSELHQIAKHSEPPFFDLREPAIKDWDQAWKRFLKPVEICSGIIVKPSWESSPKGDYTIIEIDPGMAFGTGGHPTTKLAAQGIKQVMEGIEDNKGQLGIFSALDVGTGSGILSMVAARLGVPRVVGIDIDPTSVQVATDNVARNSLGRKVAIHDDLVEDVFENFDIVVANIIADTLVDIKEDLVQRVNVGGYLVLSGILRNQGSKVKEEFLKTKVEFVTTMQEDQWCGLIFRKI